MLESSHCNQQIDQSVKEESETDNIDSNIRVDSDDGLEQDNEGGGGVPGDERE